MLKNILHPLRRNGAERKQREDKGRAVLLLNLVNIVHLLHRWGRERGQRQGIVSYSSASSLEIYDIFYLLLPLIVSTVGQVLGRG